MKQKNQKYALKDCYRIKYRSFTCPPCKSGFQFSFMLCKRIHQAECQASYPETYRHHIRCHRVTVVFYCCDLCFFICDRCCKHADRIIRCICFFYFFCTVIQTGCKCIRTIFQFCDTIAQFFGTVIKLGGTILNLSGSVCKLVSTTVKLTVIGNQFLCSCMKCLCTGCKLFGSICECLCSICKLLCSTCQCFVIAGKSSYTICICFQSIAESCHTRCKCLSTDTQLADTGCHTASGCFQTCSSCCQSFIICCQSFKTCVQCFYTGSCLRKIFRSRFQSTKCRRNTSCSGIDFLCSGIKLIDCRSYGIDRIRRYFRNRRNSCFHLFCSGTHLRSTIAHIRRFCF